MTLAITDLHTTQELDAKAMAATRGGDAKCNKDDWKYRLRNKMGDITRSIVVNDHSSIDNTGGVIATGDANEIFTLGAGNTLGSDVQFNVNF